MPLPGPPQNANKIIENTITPNIFNLNLELENINPIIPRIRVNIPITEPQARRNFTPSSTFSK